MPLIFYFHKRKRKIMNRLKKSYNEHEDFYLGMAWGFSAGLVAAAFIFRTQLVPVIIQPDDILITTPVDVF
jgi:hypothetical protein